MAENVEAKKEAEADPAEANPKEQGEELRKDKKLEDLRGDIAWIIKIASSLLLLTLGVAVALVVLVWFGFSEKRTMDATVLAASLQVAFGMVVGFVCIYLGLMMTWFGLNSAYTLKGAGGGFEGALKGSSPGLVFALGGMILVGVSLHKPIEYQEGGVKKAGEVVFDPTAPNDINVE